MRPHPDELADRWAALEARWDEREARRRALEQDMRDRKAEHLAELAEIVARELDKLPPDAALWERAQAAVAALDEAGIVFAWRGCWDG